MNIIKDICRSLLNATIMLLIILALVILLIVTRVSDSVSELESSFQNLIEAPTQRISQLQTTLKQMQQDDLHTQAGQEKLNQIASEIQTLNAHLSQLNQTMDRFSFDWFVTGLKDEIQARMTHVTR